MIAIVIIISALLGIGGGFGAFYYTKSLQSAQQTLTQKTATEETGVLTREDNSETKSQNDESLISIKHLYDNEELTKEGAITFLKLRAQMQGLPPEKVSKMIEDLNRMSQKIAVIEAFKILAMQHSLMEFAEFKEPKLKGL